MVGAEQQAHWDATLAANEEMFGRTPSQAARGALAEFTDRAVGRLLELGAGQGRDTFAFGAAGIEVVAVDFARSGVEAITARAAHESAPVAALQHDVRRPLPFADGSFDACYSHMLFCMALSTAELVALTGEVGRVVRPGGSVVYTVRHTGDAHYGAGRSLGDDLYENGGFVVHFFERELVDHLAGRDFELISVDEFEEGELPRRLWSVTMRRRP
jgi:SAM-dependent methyltransferase